MVPSTLDAAPSVTYRDERFYNEEIVVDGKRFEKCAFDNVSLVYAGGVLPEFVDCRFAYDVSLEFTGGVGLHALSRPGTATAAPATPRPRRTRRRLSWGPARPATAEGSARMGRRASSQRRCHLQQSAPAGGTGAERGRARRCASGVTTM